MAGRQLSFEIYYLNSGRWQIHARYGAMERDVAMEEAKRLDKEPHIEAVCVVRESYDTDTGNSSESVVYHTPTMKGKPPVSTITSGAATGGGGKKATAKLQQEAAPPGSAAHKAAEDKKQRIKKQKAEQPTKDPALAVPGKSKKKKKKNQADNIADLLPQLAMAFLIASVGGVLCGAAAYIILQVLASEVALSLGRVVNMLLLVGSFVCAFGMLFIPRVRVILGQMKSIQDQEEVKKQKAKVAEAKKSVADLAKELKETTEEPSPENKKDTLDQELAQAEQEKIDAEEDKQVKDLLPVAQEATANTEDVKKAIESFFSEIVSQASAIPQLRFHDNAYMQFGMMLFLAGAGEPKTVVGEWDRKDTVEALHSNMAKLGMETKQSAGFIANIEEYLLKPEYLQMYDRGRKAGMRRLSDPKSDNQVPLAFNEWLSPKPKKEEKKDSVAAEAAEVTQEAETKDSVTSAQETVKSKQEDDAARKFVAVMFTDIVDSTQNQQTKGDTWLMNVVRAHNEIVREAIAVHGGREIKHTGDGIMASFTGVFQSVDAAMAMQRGFMKFSIAVPDYAFSVRAGISAGEPIHEGGDIFGTPVNLAARVMNFADSEQIAVSAIVREMCRGKSIPFEKRGEFELKGFAEPQPIYVIDMVNTKENA